MSSASSKTKKLRLARVSTVTAKGDEILVPCFPLLRFSKGVHGARLELIAKQMQEHSLMTIAHDLLKRGIELDEIKKHITMIPAKWTKEQICIFIEENGTIEFNEGEVRGGPSPDPEEGSDRKSKEIKK
jgi:hypothetical protein